VDDHCGYALPFDPLQHITTNNAAYHDIHHQSWGIKSNFSQPFFTFWDKYLGTMWKGDVTLRYEKARRTAQQKLDQEQENKTSAIPAPTTISSAAAGTDETTRPPLISAPLRTRKKSQSISQSPSGNLKGLRNKVNESLHGRGGTVLGVDSGH
jgi:sphinganine C4-monooxygenase